MSKTNGRVLLIGVLVLMALCTVGAVAFIFSVPQDYVAKLMIGQNATATATPEVKVIEVLATDTPTATPMPGPVLVRTEVIATRAPMPTIAPTIKASSSTTLRVSAAVATKCALDSFSENARFGVQVQVAVHNGVDWEFNPSKAKRLIGDTAHPELAASTDLSGCPVVIEGRKVLIAEHDIWILIPGDGRYLDQDGIFRAKEFSAWAYPTNWNLDDWTTTKPSISAEFVTAKRHNQKQNGYDWLIVLNTSTGSQLKFPSGSDTPSVTLPNNCKFESPQLLNVTGVYVAGSNSFNASIGAEGCWTVATIDGQVSRWMNARDNVVYKSVKAYLLPSSWSQSQIDAWLPQ